MTVLKYKQGGNWQSLVSGYASNVWVGPDPPTNPNMEFWVDTDDILPVVPWTPVTFQNGWTNTSSQVCQYRKIGDIVYIRGVTSNGALGTTIFTLPAGFRPPAEVYSTLGGWTGSAWAAARAIITSDGRFTIDQGPVSFVDLTSMFSTTA